MANMFSGVSKAPGRALLPALALIAVVMLVGASSALGQAAVDQYIPSASPSGNHGGGAGGGGGGGGTTGSGGTTAGGVTGSGAAGRGAGVAKGSLGSGGAGLTNFSAGNDGSGSSSGGSAPGTDYPLTTFVFIVIGLLAAAAVTIAMVRRRRTGHTT
jgi:hypothetical protein